MGCPLKKETLGDKDWTANLPQKKWFCLGFQSNVNPRINKPVGCLVEGVSFTFKYQTITIWEYHPINKPWFHQSRVDIINPSHHREDYLVICPPVSMSLPMARDLCWMVNFDLDGDWRFVPVKRLVRALLPCALYESGRCFCWEITRPEFEPLLTSAVREGVWISLANIRQICHTLGVEPPRSKQGSGKNGAVIKVDWAQKLVQHLFPNADEQEQKRMTAALTWKSGSAKSTFDSKEGGVERTVLRMVAELDEENREAPEFMKVVKLAKSKLKEQETKETVTETRKLVLAEMKRSELEEKERLEKAEQEAARAAEQEKARLDAATSGAASSSSASRNASQTPKNLKDFLSPQMLSSKISLNRLPAGYGYRAFYESRFLHRNFEWVVVHVYYIILYCIILFYIILYIYILAVNNQSNQHSLKVIFCHLNYAAKFCVHDDS